MPTRDPRLLPPGIVIGTSLLALAAFLPSLLGPFVWDDDLYLTMNRTVRAADGLWRIWSDPFASPSPYPMVFTTYWFEFKLWGLHPLGYKLINLALHLANSWMIWRLMRRINMPGAVLAGVIFALHPIHVESVAQVAERKDVLSGFFYLLALNEWIAMRGAPSSWARSRVLLIFTLGMLSKTVICTLPVILVLLEVRESGRSRLGRALRDTTPMLIVGLLLGLYTILWERHRTGASGDVFELSFVQRLLIAGRAGWFYVGKLLWPVGHALIYPKWRPDPSDVWQWLFPLSWILMFGSLWRFRGVVCARGALAGCVFYVVTLAPALGFINYSTMYYSFVADHYQYLAGLGVIAPVAAGIERVMDRMIAGMRPAAMNRARFTPALCIAFVLAAGTLRAALPYRSVLAIWRNNAAMNPGGPTVHYDLGVACANLGMKNEAERSFRKALELEPRLIEAEVGLGGVLESRGDLTAAQVCYDRAKELEPLHRKAVRSSARAWINSGVIDFKQGRLQEARAKYLWALQVDPGSALARVNLGVVAIKEGDAVRAAVEFGKALRINPRQPDARRNLALALARSGRDAEAEVELRRALENFPDDAAAWGLYGELLQSRGDVGAARIAYRQALQLNPNDERSSGRLKELDGRKIGDR